MVDVETAEFKAKPIVAAQSRTEHAQQGRHGPRGKQMLRGHAVGFTQDASSGKVDVGASLASQLSSGEGLGHGVSQENIRYQKIAGKSRRNIVFLIDSSGSMLSADRLAMVKGCVVSLLQEAYLDRMRVAIVSFGGVRAQLVMPFSASAEMAAERIDQMKGGGTTPLASALGLVASLAEGLEGEAMEIVMLSDGRYNREVGESVERAIEQFALFCKKRNISILLVDAGAGGRTSKRRAALLARKLGARYSSLAAMRAEELYDALGSL